MNRPLDGSVFVPLLRERRLKGQKVVVVLEDACLEVVHVGEGKHEMLSGTKASHRRLLKRAGRISDGDESVSDMRPDIVYQCLCALLESPLNQSGCLLVYIHTQTGLMIEVNPQMRCPSTYSEFQSLFGTLLVKRNIRARHAGVTLLQIVKNDLNQILPPGCRKIGLEVHGRPVNLNEYIGSIAKAPENKDKYSINREEASAGALSTGTPLTEAPSSKAEMERHSYAVVSDFSVQQDLQRENRNVYQPLVVFIGAVAHGSPVAKDRNEFVEDELCISKFHLSAAECCHRICHAFEQAWLQL